MDRESSSQDPTGGDAPPGSPLRILEIETFGRGGLLHYAFNLSSALAERGHDVTLLTSVGDELAGEAEPPPGLRVSRRIARWSQRHGRDEPGLFGRQLRRIEAVADAFSVAAFARRVRPGIVHLHSTHPIALLYLALLRRLPIPLVETAHVVLPHEPMPLQRSVYGAIHRLADRVIAHSEADRRRLATELKTDPDRIRVIPHGEYGFFESGGEGADREAARRSLGLGAGDETVLFFGYLREYKGLDLLLDAWPAVVGTRPDARLLIAGDPVRLPPARRRQLEERAQALGAVHRFGYVPFAEVPRWFAAADVLAMPYRHISGSGVLYLALALGVPVVATRVGGLPEILTDGEDALLIPPESPRDLAEALGRLLDDPRLRESLAAGGRRIAEAHSWPAIARRTEAVFAELTAC